MDGLSAAASVVAIIQISCQIFDLCRIYYMGVKDARKDIERLRNEIIALQDTLVDIADLENNLNSTSLKTLEIVSRKGGPVHQCHEELIALASKLEAGTSKTEMRQFGLRALKWPFSVKEIEKILASISRHKSTFILALTVDQTSLSLSIEQAVQDITENLNAQRLDSDRKAILQWLCSTDPSTNYEAARKKSQPGSGRWVLDRPEFKEWQMTRNSVLWLHGIAGSGKTILSSIIIEKLQTQYIVPSKSAMVYFYFDFNATTKQDPAKCLSSITGQICGQIGTIPEKIEKSYEHHHFGKQQPSIEELKRMLVAAAAHLEHIFVVLDALDECPKNGGREHLLQIIGEILSQESECFHILVTSRRERDIEEALMPLLTVKPISIQGAGLEEDIKMYISWQLTADARLKKWSPAIKTEIQESLEANASGMFRWVDCQLSVLKRCLKVTLIRDALKNLPKTLDDTYSRMFLNIDEAYREDARNALIWLAFADRPLLLQELAEATVIRPYASMAFNMEDRFPDPEDILEILSSLVTVTTLNPAITHSEQLNEPNTLPPPAIVTLAHFSVQEYLISERIKDSQASFFSISAPISERHIAGSCLEYLLYHATRASTLPSAIEYPIFHYAASYWHTHLNRIPRDLEQRSLTSLAIKLLDSDWFLKNWLGVLSTIKFVFDFRDIEDSKAQKQYALFYSVEMGLFHVVQKLLEEGGDPNFQDARGESSLHLVAKTGDELTAKALLYKGASINARNSFQQTPLHWAAYFQFYGMVDLLLEWGADIDAVNKSGQTALHFAASACPKMLVHLLNKGASLDIQSQSGGTPIDWAKDETTKMLLQVEAESRAAQRATKLSSPSPHSSHQTPSP